MDRPCVLVVDDDALTLKLLGKALSLEGYEVLTAGSGAQALARLGTRPVDAAVVDIRLPGMSGLELLRELKRRDPALEVVMTTAHPDVSTAVEALKDGASDYLQKPLDLDELRHRMSRAMERRRLRGEVSAHPSNPGTARAGSRVMTTRLGDVERGTDSHPLRLPIDEETARRLRQAETLLAVSESVGSTLDLTETMRRLAREAGRAFGADMASVYEPDADGRMLRPIAAHHVPKHLLETLSRLAIPLAGHRFLMEALESGKPVHSSRVATDPRMDRATVARFPHHSALFVPMFARGEFLGGLFAVWWARARLFTGDDLQLAEAIGRHAALALHNARLFGQAARRQREAEELARVARTVTESLDIGTVATRVVESVVELLGSRTASLRLVEPDGSLVLTALAGSAAPPWPLGHTLPPGVGVPGRAVATARPVRVRDLDDETDISLTQDQRRRLGEAGYGARLAVPLRTRECVIGALTVVYDTARDFSDADVTLLEAFADQAALALQNAALHAGALRRARELDALLRASRTVMDGLDLQTTLQRIVQEAAHIAATPHAKLLLLDREAGVLRPGAVTGAAVPPDFQVPLGTSYSGRVAATGRPLFIADTQNDPENLLAARDREAGIRTFLGLPVAFGRETLGVLTFNTVDPHVYTPDELGFLAAFADQAALAIRNAQLLQQAQTREARLAALLELSRELGRIQPLDSLLRHVAEACGRLLHQSSVTLWLVEGGELVLSGCSDDLPAGTLETRLKVGESLTGIVAATGELLMVDNPGEDPRLLPPHRDVSLRLGHRTWLGVPVKIGERLLGVLSIHTLRPGAFSSEDVDVAQAFATQAATALENARLYQESRRAYEELTQTQAQLNQAQKLEAVGRLAGGIAHDFNNLLTIILGRSQVALRQLPPDHPVGRHVRLVRETAERAASLTQQLLAFSRKQVLQPRVLDLNTVLASLEKMLRRLIGEDVELVTVPGPALGRVKADPTQLEQVILNLSVNARDAMPQGGRLALRTANVEVDEAMMRHHPEARPGGHVRLEVSDTGCGMDAETRARIFEPFFTTKGEVKGTGLGLATVYGIVKQSGGFISVYSEPGLGATFRIYLPRVDEASASESVAGVGSCAPGSETILLAEDEVELRELVSEMLESYGYTVLAAASVEEAIEIAADYRGPIHLLLTDVIMPRLSGRALAERIVSLHAETRVLFMSGYTDDVIGHHGVLEPGTRLLQKPFSTNALASAVREALDAKEVVS